MKPDPMDPKVLAETALRAFRVDDVLDQGRGKCYQLSFFGEVWVISADPARRLFVIRTAADGGISTFSIDEDFDAIDGSGVSMLALHWHRMLKRNEHTAAGGAR